MYICWYILTFVMLILKWEKAYRLHKWQKISHAVTGDRLRYDLSELTAPNVNCHVEQNL